ncbi:hypothetical protein [Sphingobacterium faecium]|jgi:hypothetical protein
MKKEELKQLEAKYLAGETTLAEERLLKEHSEDGYFSLLAEKNTDEMLMDFDSFLARTDEAQKTVHKLPQRKIWTMFSSIAAAILLICLGIWYLPSQQVVSPIEQTANLNKPLKKTPEADRIKIDSLVENGQNSEKMVTQTAAVRHRVDKHRSSILEVAVDTAANQVAEEEFYVEVNGVKITNEEQALKITENALLFASSNLKKGMKEVENIKCLSIEL